MTLQGFLQRPDSRVRVFEEKKCRKEEKEKGEDSKREREMQTLFLWLLDRKSVV